MSAETPVRFRLGVDVGAPSPTSCSGARTGRPGREGPLDPARLRRRDPGRGGAPAPGDGVAPEAVDEVVHGTTVATNAILEHRGARTGLLTTAGFRDVLEIRRLRMPRLYDLDFERPAPLVPRRWRREVDERMNARGEIVQPLDRASALAAIDRARRRRRGSDRRLPAPRLREPRPRAGARRRSSRARAGRRPRALRGVLPEIRRVRADHTTVVNAYVDAARSAATWARWRATWPARRRGPAAGDAVERRRDDRAGGPVPPGPRDRVGPGGRRDRDRGPGPPAGVPNVISIDMGGTTAKASVVEGGGIQLTAEYEIGGSMSRAAGSTAAAATSCGCRRSTSPRSARAAGASSRRHGGALHVGPRSAGASPGPACYGLGGTQRPSPTPTSASAISPRAAAERPPARRRARRRAVTEQVAQRLGLPLHEAAYGAYLFGGASMVRAVRAVSHRAGRDPRDFALVAFGGNGPLFAARWRGRSGSAG